MWTGDKVFFDLVSTAVGDRYALQAFIDATKEAYNKLDLSGFNWSSSLLPDFSFEQIEKEYGINAMATWVDLDSPGTPVSIEGASLQTGKVPRQKKYAAFDENDFRQLAIKRVSNSSLVDLAQDALFNINKKLIDSHTNAMTYMRHQMVSKGKFELTTSNNAGGIAGTVFSASIPDANKVAKKTTYVWWADGGTGAEGTDSDPVADMKAIGEKVNGTAYHWEVDALTLKKLLGHSAVKTAIGYSLYPLAASAAAALQAGTNLIEAQRKARLEEIVGFPIVAIDSISRVDKFDKGQKKVVGVEVRSFEPYNLALVPDGQIGETIAVAPYAVGDASNFAEYYGGRLMITYDFDVRKKTQYMESELTALVVPDKPKYMHILTVA